MIAVLRCMELVVLVVSVLVPAGDGTGGAAATGAQRQSVVREITITARRHEFSPSTVEVNQGDIVRITLIAEDAPHGFTIDEYRIAKKVSPARPITFEFVADRAGRFVFYCSLSDDPRCRHMRGELIVHDV